MLYAAAEELVLTSSEKFSASAPLSPIVIGSTISDRQTQFPVQNLTGNIK